MSFVYKAIKEIGLEDDYKKLETTKNEKGKK